MDFQSIALPTELPNREGKYKERRGIRYWVLGTGDWGLGTMIDDSASASLARSALPSAGFPPFQRLRRIREVDHRGQCASGEEA